MSNLERLRAFAYGPKFEGFFLNVIVLSVIIIGVETCSDAALLRLLENGGREPDEERLCQLLPEVQEIADRMARTR